MEGLDNEIHYLENTYEHIRQGCHTTDTNCLLEGNDNHPDLFSIYYNEDCDITSKSEYETEFHWLCCFSLTRLLELIMAAGESLMMLDYSDPINRGNENYAMIIMMDNYNNANESILDDGAALRKAEMLANVVEVSVGDDIRLLQDFSLLFLVLGLPLFSLVYFLVAWKYPRNMNKNLNLVRNLMILMNKESLSGKEIFSYISGKERYSVVFQKQQRNKLDSVCDALMISKFGILVFNKKGVSIHLF